MPYYKLGPIIRMRRQELGLTQEALSEGICAVNTLSRYENGERIPKKDHLEMLMTRLGYSDAMLDSYIDETAFALHELRYRIRQAFILERFEKARELLDEYEGKADKSSKVSKQFILLYRTNFKNELTLEERLSEYLSAIRITCPRFSEDYFPSVLSYEEIIIINHIAGVQFELGKIENAIKIYLKLKQYYDSGMTNPEERLRTELLVLYNLSKCLGCASRYEECIDICNSGIRLSRETGKCNYLAWLLYNKAWALSKQDKPGSMDAARDAALLARNMAVIMGDSHHVEHIDRFAMQTFGFLIGQPA